jgi:predicted type IV restriction endonuclease
LDFNQKVTDLAVRSRHATKHALTEEATKTAVVMPLLQSLGFDVFNLEEVVPEFVADVGIKKGEKIDFAIRIDGKMSILMEVKPISMALGSAQYSQLFRYFGTTEAKLAILTNGKEIWFFSDIDEKNKMDKRPFFIFDLQNYDDHQIVELARFQKSNFDIEKIFDAASKLKYVKAAGAFISRQLANPDDDFVKLVGRDIYEGSLTKSAIELLRPAIQAALDEVVRRRIQERLNVTFGAEATIAEPNEKKAMDTITPEGEIVTSEDEVQAFMIIRAIGSSLIPISRITMRDARTYCSVFVDDNNRKPVCRFYFNSKNSKAIGVFDSQKVESKHVISELGDLYKFQEQVTSAIASYL